MKAIFLTINCLLTTLSLQAQPKVDVQKEMEFAKAQYELMLEANTDLSRFPQSVKKEGTLDTRTSDWWCSGFFGGSLWYLYEYTKDDKWKEAADKWTMAVEKEKYNTTTHDLGFMLYCSFGNGYRLIKNEKYKDIMLVGAESLATRFNPKIGLIKSWEEFKRFDYPVIIDNMMNLEFLLWAAKASGNSKFYDLSITHADNTLKNHFRKDYSSYHVVCYDRTGNVLAKKTNQGAADESAWARGQAWALYGYTMMYRATGDKKYLNQAKNIAKFIANHPNLPSDKIPYWDFNAPNIPNEERDASAAAITASALLEMYSYTNDNAHYRLAEEMLVSLSSKAYTANLGENNYFLLKHSVGSKPYKSEVNTPIIYADYYYLEALLRYSKIRL
ncbi:glycoside hydrolase family 88 protein [Parapedobacter tibetensis]|uniref:glycoside hydrolase family 88 protein n=1 Tax=Parapedobacter tibetensis TaxID=2972951 RepID=UPI00214DD070|nr:glycoside hydrolase family 88 protein [Parapedobacter tibetensis]